MSNIYLRLPSIVVQYFRNRDEKHPLRPDEPLELSEYDCKYNIIKYGCSLKVDTDSIRQMSYTYTQWRSMCRGCHPVTGKLRIKTKKDFYPTYKDVCDIVGVEFYDKYNGYEYLCIKLPNILVVGDKTCHSTPNHGLVNRAAKELRSEFLNVFKTAFLVFYRDNVRFCLQQKILREKTDIIERFFCRYNINSSDIDKSKRTLYREITRWQNNTIDVYNSDSNIDNFDIERIDRFTDKIYTC